MESRTYYGEYSLKHWIDLMLNGNIVLPEYQRSFVWSEKNLKRLIASLSEKQFVPPVTLARYVTDNGENKNLILDGQQRLTSILLAYLGLFPDCSKFQDIGERLSSGDDSASDETDATEDKPIGWTFQKLLSEDHKGNTRDAIRARLLPTGNYADKAFLDENQRDNFLKSTFLGFSFIVPQSSNQEEIRKMFSQLFRNVNYFGMPLSALESRRSLYYLNENYKDFFDGRNGEGKDVLCGIGIIDHLQPHKLDILRYLSALSQYTSLSDHNIKKVMRGYAAYSMRESYYADYVSYVLGLEQESYEDKFNNFFFDTAFPNHCWRERYDKLSRYLTELRPYMRLKEDKDFTSWIDADYWLFGLIYKVLFLDEPIGDILKLRGQLNEEIIKKREGDPSYAKSPNRLGYLRERITESIRIYENC